MKVLLDENIPVGLARRLRADGWEVEHPILTGRRGLPDAYFLDDGRLLAWEIRDR